MSDKPQHLAQVAAYHELSSLDPEGSNAAPPRLQRSSEPIPFRRYEGATRIPLPIPAAPEPRPDTATAFDLPHLGRFFYQSMALAGWKCRGEARFGMRVLPSAGNLHPTEAYLLTLEPTAPDSSSPALYHYSAFDHALERRRRIPPAVAASLRSLAPADGVFLGLSTLYWRCAWKYGERAFRLCHLDAGHAVAALAAAAQLQRWHLRRIDTGDDSLAELLGLGSGRDAETERPLCLLALSPEAEFSHRPWSLSAELRDHLRRSPLEGRPTRSSQQYRNWPGLEAVEEASRSSGDEPQSQPHPPVQPSAAPAAQPPWPAEILRRRRSRSNFSPRALLSREDLTALLTAALGPSSLGNSFREVELLLFVHRVQGLEPGLYWAGPKRPGADTATDVQLRQALRPDLLWKELEPAPPDLRLALLAPGDARRAAAFFAGRQSAAGEASVTVVFLAPFAPVLEAQGAWAYRRLHWRAGEMGHHLYLCAEARRLAATGLSGFYDRPLLDFLGITGESFRPLYLLALGPRGEEDPPLEAPYSHLAPRLASKVVPAPPSRGGYRSPPVLTPECENDSSTR